MGRICTLELRSSPGVVGPQGFVRLRDVLPDAGLVVEVLAWHGAHVWQPPCKHSYHSPEKTYLH